MTDITQQLAEGKEIPLTQGKIAIVDVEDYEELSQRSWCYHPTGYACS